MPKLFITSDIHSYFTPFKEALDEAEFDPNNEEHWLIVCGDCFDRGPESVELLHYLMQLERKILIKGNHDLLFEECCYRKYPKSHDKSNGTLTTILDISGIGYKRTFDECCTMAFNKTAEYRRLLVNYFETKNYIFVHSWIPTKKLNVPNPADKWIPLTTDEYMEDWRSANDVEWEDAMWGNPFKLALLDLNKTDKTIVFGHWHCSAGHKMLGSCDDEFDNAIWEPCYFKNTIGVDRCTAYTGECNVLVIEDEFLEVINDE